MTYYFYHSLWSLAGYTHALAGLFWEKEDFKICLQRADMGTPQKVSSLSEKHSSSDLF